ncbi:phage tail terminator-like protein [Xenorhabdus khoisanae]|uniref:phage tail terminator-like protein n=1 Tax=Xenorhabdus khoisanae TaxID=880157 RepID=UPI002358B4C1|nr:phage tail terminator-like protein [Xenorhabdus khoisanae]MDC9615602.1 phage tail terminator-like protein [Xenorhabdus khoisanae]
MNQSTINNAIRSLVAKIAKQESLKVAWPNISFDDINDPYLQLHIMPATTQNIGLSLDMPVFRGVIQVNVVGKSGSGDSALTNIADRIAEHLQNGVSLTMDLYLNDEPTIFPSIQDGSNYTIPIRTSYRCDAVR